ncbi:Thiamine-monophosphate kinase [hydrothermal vent metagenome]|uniref:Thiamine-monophosphate kinase n=1 Tax=hydrothermal vent metagenome TaxID=652676 RepID=A0A3B1AQU5_9ZZZZ
MSESEFDIIRKYFTEIGKASDWLVMGIGDDAAIIAPSSEHQLLISIDTLNLGVHFPGQCAAIDIGYKALAVNLSDIAAMGGEPKWFTLSLSLPSIDHNWLKDFCLGLSQLASKHNLKLVGGDTTRGPLSITIQIAGETPAKEVIKRDGAKVGDSIYVTGTLGDAAAGLALCAQNEDRNSYREALVDKLNKPIPRIAVGMALRSLATACIDISDGLAGDLGHILEDSGVGAELEQDAIPFSDELLEYAEKNELTSFLELSLYGGDDYELCFTAAEKSHEAIEKVGIEEDCKITRIGKIISDNGLYLVEDNDTTEINITGFDHFNT